MDGVEKWPRTLGLHLEDMVAIEFLGDAQLPTPCTVDRLDDRLWCVWEVSPLEAELIPWSGFLARKDRREEGREEGREEERGESLVDEDGCGGLLERKGRLKLRKDVALRRRREARDGVKVMSCGRALD